LKERVSLFEAHQTDVVQSHADAHKRVVVIHLEEALGNHNKMALQKGSLRLSLAVRMAVRKMKME
jgi:hypothetical protein